MRFKNSTTLAACAVLVLAALWSRLDLPALPNADAQSASLVTQQADEKTPSFAEQSRARIEAKLGEPIPDVTILQQPLREVLVKLKELTGIVMYFDSEELGDVIDPDVPITVKVDADSMTFNTLINEFILGPEDLEFVICDNFMVVMSYDKYRSIPEATQLVVYNCRDLLAGIPDQPAAAATSGVSGGEAAMDPDRWMTAPGEPGGMSVERSYSDIGAREQQLVNLIIGMTISNEESPWDDSGPLSVENVGSVEAFNGMLVTRGLPEMHEQVQELLRLLHESSKKQAWPADLGDWPHKKRVPPPEAPAPGGEKPPSGGAKFF